MLNGNNDQVGIASTSLLTSSHIYVLCITVRCKAILIKVNGSGWNMSERHTELDRNHNALLVVALIVCLAVVGIGMLATT